MKLPDIPAVEFRNPLQVTRKIIFSNGYEFPICPRCKITIEREYMSFCDRCGQRLNWKGYSKAVIIRK